MSLKTNQLDHEETQQKIEELRLFVELLSTAIRDHIFTGKYREQKMAALDRIAGKI